MNDMIVAGVTEAPVATRVIEWAARRASDRHQRLRLVTVIPGATGVVGEASLISAAVDEAREGLQRASAPLRERGIAVESVVLRGHPVDKLLEAAADATMLVIGSDYRGPESARDRGARGMRIAAAASCPVVVVPDIDVENRSGIVVGVDGSAISENAVAFAAAEADRLHEPLIAVSVWTPIPVPHHLGGYPVDYLDNLQLLTGETLGIVLAGLRSDFPDLEIVTRATRGYPAAVINHAAASARMTVVGTHGRGAFTRFLLGSIAHEVLSRLATVTAVVR